MDNPLFHLHLVSVLLLFCQASNAAVPEVVVAGLDNPRGIAIQPETGHVFVSESGRGRVIRIVDGQPQDVVVGFPLETIGQDPGERIGPLGLAFLNKDILVIGGGGQPDGQDVVYVVSVPAVGTPAVSRWRLAIWSLAGHRQLLLGCSDNRGDFGDR